MTLESPTATSEQTAEEGCVLVSGPHRDYILSDAVAWREGDTYVIRSSEFDVMAEAEDFSEAIDVFVCRLLDYTSMLHDLVDKDCATPDEASAFMELAGRFFPLVEALQRARPRKRLRWPPRCRGSGSGHWRHRGTQASGSAQLSAT
jgi:hypothetical protein